MRRIAITGIGAVTPLAHSAEESFSALLSGRSGVGAVSFDLTEDHEVRIGGQVKDFDPLRWMVPKEARRHARFTHFAVAAAKQALKDAAWDHHNYRSERIGTILGAGLGGVEIFADAVLTLKTRGARRVSPFAAVSLFPNIAPAMVAIEAQAQGPSYSTTSACASSAHALGEALRMLRAGVVDAVIAGGSEASLTPVGLAAFASIGVLSHRNDEPEKASRPFDRDRDGFVMSEGSAVMVLEPMEEARARGAKVYAELLGYGASADARHVTQPDSGGRGAALAMRAALADARIDPQSVDYINAHGTSTRHNDLAETHAIRGVFGAHADKLWVSSTKSMTGHMMGAAGAFEALVCALALREGVVPPTINLDAPGEGCDLDYVAGASRRRQLSTALSNSFGFGGQNVSLVLRAAT